MIWTRLHNQKSSDCNFVVLLHRAYILEDFSENSGESGLWDGQGRLVLEIPDLLQILNRIKIKIIYDLISLRTFRARTPGRHLFLMFPNLSLYSTKFGFSASESESVSLITMSLMRFPSPGSSKMSSANETMVLSELELFWVLALWAKLILFVLSFRARASCSAVRGPFFVLAILITSINRFKSIMKALRQFFLSVISQQVLKMPAVQTARFQT